MREAEITRLSETLELGKDLTALSAHNAHETNLKTIDQLNQQVKTNKLLHAAYGSPHYLSIHRFWNHTQSHGHKWT